MTPGVEVIHTENLAYFIEMKKGRNILEGKMI